MNHETFFALAKEKGISESQIHIANSKSISISLFHHEIDEYTIAENTSVVAAGIYQGKLGTARSDRFDKEVIPYLVEQIIASATYHERPGEADLFKGSEKYCKKNVFNKELPLIPIEKKIADLREFENDIYAQDPRVCEVEASYSESEAESEFYNSHGLKLKQRRNHFVFTGSAVAKEKEETKTNYELFVDCDYQKLDLKALAKKVVAGATAKFGGEPCQSGVYPTVLRQDIAASFIGALLSSAIAEEVQKQSSFLEGKIGTKVASKKLTIEEKPTEKNLFFTYFDDEGVATHNQTVIKNGVLQMYFYNRETAKKDGVTSTGNGYWAGGKMGTDFTNVFVKPGKASFEELIAPIKDGVYITEIMGLGTGMNVRSGDFSCQAEGFRIVDGKVAEPLNLITLSGNLLKMFQDLVGFDNQTKLTLSSITVADAYIKKMNIGGK